MPRSKDAISTETARFPVIPTGDISDLLYDAMRVSGAVNVFLQPPAAMVAWSRRLSPVLMDEILLLGVQAACRATRKRVVSGKGRFEARRAVSQKRNLTVRAKTKAFDRVVEMLDHLDVEGKPLGDCTKADLLRAAVAAQERAGEWTVKAALFREVAGLLGNETVREYKARGQIVALLTTTFKEPA